MPIINRNIRRTENGIIYSLDVLLYHKDTFCDLANDLRAEALLAEKAYMAPSLVMEYVLDILRKME